MAGHPYNNSQLSRMDHIQARNRPHNGPLPFGQKLFVPPRSDALNGDVSSAYGGMAMRSNDHPSASYTTQYHGQQIGNPGTSHASYPSARSSSSSYVPYDTQPMPALSYPHRSEESFIPGSYQVEDRRVALKRKNSAIHPMDGISAGGYYAGNSSNPQFSSYMQPNPHSVPESSHPQMPLNAGPSHWNDHHFINEEGSQRNVRGRHDQNAIHLEYTPAAACPSSSIHVPPFHSNASAPPQSMPVEWSRVPPPRIAPPGTTGSTSIALRERPYYPAHQSTNLSAPVPTLPGPSDNLPFTHGGYAPGAVHHSTIHNCPQPTSAATSSSRAVSHETAIPSYLPTTSTATSTSLRIGQPFPAEATASLRNQRHVPTGHGGTGRSRRARNSFHGFHPSVLEDSNFGRWAAERSMMLDRLVIYESREAVDPHWDMRLDIDDMSYEELLALEERIGNVNTGLADEKLSVCVAEVVCCSSDHKQNDPGDERCIICLEEYKDKDALGKLKCGHDFHTDCIKKWLQAKNSCPVCKAAAADDS